MKLKQCLLINSLRLKKVDIPTPTLDVEILLCEVLSKNRAWVLAHPEYVLSGKELSVLSMYVERRKKHEPIAYIRGKQEFYGRDFHVSPATLTPRPETETLVELTLEIIKNETVDTIADVGTGSGCIAITLAVESSKPIAVTGYDISRSALDVARKNNEELGGRVTFTEDDVTRNGEHGWTSTDAIVANLPYVPTDFQINLAATHEPDFAIYGGNDGLAYYRDLFGKLHSTTYVITESLPPQHTKLKEIARNAGYKELKKKDFIQVFMKK